MKTRLLIFSALLALVPMLLGACAGEASIPSAPPTAVSPQTPLPPTPSTATAPPLVPAPPTVLPLAPEDMQAIAEELVRMSETFLFDGIEESLKLASVQAGAQPGSWTFTFEFQSRHAGYGDRTGEILAQVITPHKVVVTVTKDEITSAVMDGQRDILAGEA